MAVLKPFKGVRPEAALVSSVAALPYDVYNRKEAKEEVKKNPLSFLKIDRAETQFPDDMDMYAQEVYDKARDTLYEMIQDGTFIQDTSDCYYLYTLTMNGRAQNGLVGCASIDDYLNNTIKKHENTRADKEQDRIQHVDTLNAQTGPIFLAYRPDTSIHELILQIKKAPALYDFTSSDGIQHQLWKIADVETICRITALIADIPALYIADGHHRAASAVQAGLIRRREHPDYDGTEEFNYFLSVLFPADELKIYDYNRVVSGLNGHTPEQLLASLRDHFDIKELTAPYSYDNTTAGGSCPSPARKGEFCMYMQGTWYRLTADSSCYADDPVLDLDVSVLQNFVLDPLFGIKEPKTDPRISFVGGIRGLKELTCMVDESTEAVEKIAFAMYPTSMDELLRVADASLLMPPKSTWFEPKLRSGLLIHLL